MKYKLCSILGQFAGLNYTVTGEPRRKEVKIPASIQGSKPGAITNQKV